MNDNKLPNTLQRISEKEIYFCEDFVLSKIKEWDKIRIHKTTYLSLKNTEMAWKSFGDNILRYPGFIFSNEDDSDRYYRDFYNLVEDVFTPPRGNLSSDSEFMIIGIKPGSYFAHLSKHENCWLLGPSSEMLNRLLIKKSIYPYYTNVYRSHKDEENKDISLILKEIEVVKSISPNIKIIFLGNYEEYNQIIAEMGKNIAYIKAWHPSYLLRNFSPGKFSEWASQIRR